MSASETNNLQHSPAKNRFQQALEVKKQKCLMRHKRVSFISQILIHVSSDKPAVFNSQPAVLLLEGLGESVIHKQKVKIFDLKYRDTEYLTLLSHLQ